MRAAPAALWAAAAFLGAADAALAQATTDPAAAVSGEADGGLALVCLVSGYDVVLRNEGEVSIPAGTVVIWEVPYARMEGSHELSSPLDPGGQAFLSAVLGSSYLDPRKPCNSEISASEEPIQSFSPDRQEIVVDFASMSADQAPAGFDLTVTGPGVPGRWVVQQDPDSPSGSEVLVQVSDEPARAQFPLAIYNDVSATDLELSVRFRPLSGSIDQAAGLVWRYQDEGNYYVARANALEGNVVAYKVENGERTDLPLVGQGRTYGVEAEVPTDAWSTLAIHAVGARFTVSLNGIPLFEVEDGTFAEPGKVGLWTKADSVVAFDDLGISPVE